MGGVDQDVLGLCSTKIHMIIIIIINSHARPLLLRMRNYYILFDYII